MFTFSKKKLSWTILHLFFLSRIHCKNVFRKNVRRVENYNFPFLFTIIENSVDNLLTSTPKSGRKVNIFHTIKIKYIKIPGEQVSSLLLTAPE